MIKMEYTGPIPELRGKIATVRPVPVGEVRKFVRPDRIVLGQFDERVIFNGKRLDATWEPFPRAHFTPMGAKPVI